MLVGRELTKLEKEFSQLSIERVDIVTNATRALKEGVRMIPDLRFKDENLSGVFLSPAKIREFVHKALQS